MKRIEKLTPEQAAILPEKRDEWIKHGLSTEPANRADTLPLRSSAEWSELLGLMVLDPDGWDRSNFAESWAELISVDEFKRRASKSTVDMRRYRELFGT